MKNHPVPGIDLYGWHGYPKCAKHIKDFGQHFTFCFDVLQVNIRGKKKPAVSSMSIKPIVTGTSIKHIRGTITHRDIQPFWILALRGQKRRQIKGKPVTLSVIIL